MSRFTAADLALLMFAGTVPLVLLILGLSRIFRSEPMPQETAQLLAGLLGTLVGAVGARLSGKAPPSDEK